MPYLGDFLGQLLGELAIARFQADLETIRLAEIYATHPLLRTMAVPRIRLPEVNLEVPVLIEQSEGPRPGEPVRGGVALQAIRERFDSVIEVHLSRARVTLTAADRRRLMTIVGDRLRAFGGPKEIVPEVGPIADDLIAAALTFVAERPRRPSVEPDVGSQLAAELSEALRVEFLKLRTSPPRLVALVTTAEIKAVDAPDAVTRFRVRLTEEGMEWTTVNPDSRVPDRLVPE